MTCLSLPACTVDLEALEVRRPEGTQHLTRSEAAILALLAATPGQAVARDQLLVEALGYAPGVRSRALDHAVRRLRHKIEADPSAPDALVSVYGVGYRLDTAPAESDESLIGRRDELHRLRALHAAHRLVTVVGAGGVGKTRLLEAFAGRRRVVRLGPVAPGSADGWLAAVARALGIALSGRDARAHTAQLARVLAHRAEPLLLDELEHLLEPAAATIATWLRAIPDLRIVVTSRHALGVPGEARLILDPLPPADAARLFTLKIERIRPGHRPDAAERAAIDRIVTRLDGLPVALELAALRSRVLDLAALADRLEVDLSVLDRTRRSLDDVLASSWALLDDPQQQSLALAAVLPGGFTAEAWEGMGGALDTLEELVEHSLVAGHPGERFRLLEAVRYFARARLAERPEGAELVGRAHRWLVQDVERHADTALLTGALAPLRAERDNLADAAADLDDAVALRALLLLDLLLQGDGPLDERVRRLEAGAARPSSPALRVDILWRLSDARRRIGDVEGASEALDRAESLASDDRLGALVAYARGTLALSAGDVRSARERLLRARPRLAAEGEHLRAALATYNLANTWLVEGRAAEAEAGFRDAVDALDAIGATAFLAPAWSGLAMACLAGGRPKEALAGMRRAVALEEGTPHMHRLHHRRQLALVACHAGQPAEAEATLQAVLDEARVQGEPGLVADALDGLGRVRAALGRPRDALEALEAARSAFRDLGRGHFAALADAYAAACCVLLELPGEARARADRAATAAAGGPAQDEVRAFHRLVYRALGEPPAIEAPGDDLVAELARAANPASLSRLVACARAGSVEERIAARLAARIPAGA